MAAGPTGGGPARPLDGVAVIDDGDTREIETPELRLVFRRLADRWTHALLIGPCNRPDTEWVVLAEPIEWYEALDDPTRVVSPVYQDLQVSTDGAGARVLAVGQAGPHHFSAAIRVTRSWSDARERENVMVNTRVEFDVADRCRGEVRALESNYLVHHPPTIGKPCVTPDPYGSQDPNRCREQPVWETLAYRSEFVSVRGATGVEGAARAAWSRWPGDPYRVRIAPVELSPSGTNRLRYFWDHTMRWPRSEAEGLPGS